MRYFGGKSRIAKQLASYLSQYENPIYWEPFCGSCAVTFELMKLKPNITYVASDINEALITMWNAVKNDFEFPNEITKEQYITYQKTKDPKDVLTAFIGIGCSFAGKFFDGFASSKDNRNYAQNIKNSLDKVKEQAKKIRFEHKDFFERTPKNILIYCDPPYANTRQEFSTKNFDSAAFWDRVRILSKDNTVIVSEYVAPDDFECVLEIITKTDIRSKNVSKERVEKLWKYKG
jgi:DNA adenine methylase